MVTTDECQEGDPGTFKVLMETWRKDPEARGRGQFTWVEEVVIHILGYVSGVREEEGGLEGRQTDRPRDRRGEREGETERQRQKGRE